MQIKLVILDFDGVFTDGKCYFDNTNIKKYYNIKDGMALSILKNNNIKYGLISSYNTKKNILINENNINDEIINHLKFDYTYIGSESKINILNKWLEELNLTYDNVAYIGDDINDIPVMKLVKFSACPNDAVQECRNIVNYTCEKKGGEGCVREFVDLIINKKNLNILQEIKREVNFQIDNFDLNEINNLVEVIKQKNNIYFTGIGKSENIAKHCADLLKSISINAFYINSTNALHGDIGTINENDMVFLFSKSGNTEELTNLIPFLKLRKCYIVGICCDKNSKFIELCDLTINLPFHNEILGNINKIPTNSCMSQLLFCNILVSKLKENITIEKYKENHPYGIIGNKLKKIKDCIINEFPKIIFNKEIKLNEILLEMTKYKIGCCFFVNKNNELLGILTDGDIRRLLLKNENKKIINIDDINTNYYYEDDLEKFLFECKKYNYVPILDNGKLINITSIFSYS